MLTVRNETARMARTIAGPTVALATRVYKGVDVVEGVALGAVGDRCMARSHGLSPEQISAARDSLKMVGPNAAPYSAEMVDLHSFGNWPDDQHISNTVGFCEPLSDSKLSVTAAVNASRPEPAVRALLDLRPKAFFKRWHLFIIQESPASYLVSYNEACVKGSVGC